MRREPGRIDNFDIGMFISLITQGAKFFADFSLVETEGILSKFTFIQREKLLEMIGSQVVRQR